MKRVRKHRSRPDRASQGARRTVVIEPRDVGRTLQSVLHDRAGFSHAQARGLIDAEAVTGPRTVRPGDYTRRVTLGERYEIRHDPARRYRPRPGPRPGARVPDHPSGS